MKVYAKDSMDRLGDDLTEEVLQYLTFEDKIRLECVSKQWKRCVFEKQFVIEIGDNKTQNSLNRLLDNRKQLNEELFESVLKKCPNIKKVNLLCKVFSEVLSLIGRYCHHLKSLTYCGYFDGKDGNIWSFFGIYGHKLEEFHCTAFPGSFQRIIKDEKKLLRLCSNIKTIFVWNSSVLFIEDKAFLPKLERIESNILITSENCNQLKILSDKYSQTMKTLNVDLNALTAEELKTCIECIARFENLKELKLEFNDMKITKPIYEGLILIGQKCNKILKLDLSIKCSVPITHRFFEIFTRFIAIRKLKINFHFNRGLSGSVECLKHCKQLNDIDIDFWKLKEEFFTNIELFVPKLQILRIKAYKQFSDSFINNFYSMKNIEKLHLNVFDNRMIDRKYYYFGKSLSEVMLSPNGMNVKHITHNCGLHQTYYLY